jgi:cytidylate kinase
MATREKTGESIVICVSGMAGSGKSTVAKKIAEKYRFKYYSGGDALKSLAIEEGYKPLNSGWWENKEGMRFLAQREKNPKYDETVDKKLLEFSKHGSVVLDSWTMPWLVKKGFKIWLDASLEKRAERIAKRDKKSVKEALEALKVKEKKTRAIYEKLYGFSLGEDFAPFNLILDTDNLKAEEVFKVLCEVLDKMRYFPKFG